MAMPMGSPTGGDYDAYAEAYAPNVAWRERDGAGNDPFGILPPMLDLLGDLSGQRVLDAGCGEGYLARLLAASGARITGIDISPRLIEQAQGKDPGGAIEHLDVFLSTGLRLTKLADLASLADQHPPYAIVPEGDRFPRFMLLGFVKP